MIFRHLLNMRSHPTWVRGLKLRSDCFALDTFAVAPYVGAWIETLFGVLTRALTMSHPTWVRGLKHGSRSIELL